LPSAIGNPFVSAPFNIVVTWNISPAPSQSEAVMSGVCTYWNPFDLKKECVAKANAERTRATAPMMFERGRK
jgi:hypothetical protein